MLFFYASGHGLFALNRTEETFSSKEWLSFVTFLYQKLSESEFTYKNINYMPESTKFQLYKLKKNAPDIPEVFINGTDGDIVIAACAVKKLYKEETFMPY